MVDLFEVSEVMVDHQTIQVLQQRISSLSPNQRELLHQQLKDKGIDVDWNDLLKPASAMTDLRSRVLKPRPERLPLSASQRHLWVLHQLYPDTSAYHIAMTLQLVGDLNIEALTLSLKAVVTRHESLRTVFVEQDNQPYQRVLANIPFELSVLDLTDVLDQYAEVKRWRRQLSHTTFNLETGPLIRACLLKLQVERFELILVLHHLIADGWSRGVLLQELAANYRGYVEGLPVSLSDLAIQYPDYVLQQQQWLQSDDSQPHLAYWKKQLADLAPLNLPSDRSGGTDFCSCTCTRTLSKGRTQALKVLGRQSGATLFTLLLAVFKLLLHRYSGQRDIVVGIPVAGRNTPAVEPLIGFFVNTLALRSRLAAYSSFMDWLQQVQTVVADALQHQETPFSEVVDAVGAERTPGHNPLFRVMFQVQSSGYQLQNSEQLDLNLPGLTLTQGWIELGYTKFDMSWHVIERDGELLMAVEYRTELFDQARIERMLGHFQTLVDAVLAEPDALVSNLSLLSAQERRQVLGDWSQGSPVAASPVCCFQARFEQQVERTPGAIAAYDRAQQRSLTYQQLNQRANQLAHWLKAQGVGPEVLVGVCLPLGLDLMVALLATLKAGGAYAPLDPALPIGRLQTIVRDASPSVLISRSEYFEQIFSDTPAAVFCVDRDESQLKVQPCQNLPTTVASTNLAYVIYTSGSTGKPKGTMLTHGGLIDYLDWCVEAYPISQGWGAPVQSSIGFDATITSLFAPLLVGRQISFGWGGSEIESVQAALSSGASFIKLTPAHLSALKPLLAHHLSSQKAEGDTPGQLLRDRLPKALIIGGEALHEHHIAVWRDQYPEVELINEYGPTEAVVGCCVYWVGAEDSGNLPIGYPIKGVQLYVLDEYLEPVPVGIPGELYIGGAGVARGYFNQPALTAERFIPNPFLEAWSQEIGDRSLEPGVGSQDPSSALRRPSSVLYKTGDLVCRREDGVLDY